MYCIVISFVYIFVMQIIIYDEKENLHLPNTYKYNNLDGGLKWKRSI
jgi:hypothetical protein